MTENEVLEFMNRRERQLLVHSFIYYRMNDNIISDHDFDLWSKEIVEAFKKYPEIAKRSVYYSAFEKFDGSSGFDLPHYLPEIQNTGQRLLKQHKKLINKA